MRFGMHGLTEFVLHACLGIENGLSPTHTTKLMRIQRTYGTSRNVTERGGRSRNVMECHGMSSI